jgi:hypothetical protein
MSMKIRILAVLFFLLLLPTFTYAAITGVAKTGQSVCYNASGTEIACAGTGQDGDIQIGSAWPTQRFTSNADETVTDNMTGLVTLDFDRQSIMIISSIIVICKRGDEG